MKVWKSNGGGRAGRWRGWRVPREGRAVATWLGEVPGKREWLHPEDGEPVVVACLLGHELEAAGEHQVCQ